MTTSAEDRTLILLRHADPEPGRAGQDDRERPLSEHGRNQAADVGRWLREQGLGCDEVMCSPSLRTRETMQELAAAGCPEAEVQIEHRLYNADADDVLSVIRGSTNDASILLVVGLVPGMPNLAFLSLAAIVGYAAWAMRKRSLAAEREAAQPDAGQPSPEQAASAELGWDDLRPVDPLGLEVGYRLIPLVDKAQGGELMARIKAVRRKLTQDVGFLIPPVHIRDNLELSPTSYRLLVHGVPVATAEVHPDRLLALDPGGALHPIDGIPGKDPAFGLDALWIQPVQRATAEAAGYTVVDPATVVATHLSHLVREQAPELLGHEEVQQLLATLARSAPKLAEDLTPKSLPLAVVVRVLQNLLVERIPVRQLRRIAEALVEHAAHTQDPAQLTAVVRTALGRFIVQEIAGPSEELPVYTLAANLERVLQDSAQGGGAALEPGLAERLQQSLATCAGQQEARNEPAVVLVPGQVRAALARLVRHSVPNLSVLSYNEVPEDKRLKLLGTIN